MHLLKHHTTESIRELLCGFRDTVEEWRSQFDNPPQLELDFFVDSNGMLCLNSTVLCPVNTVESKDALISEWDMFFLKTNTGDTFDILLTWPFMGPPEVVRIIKSRDVYVRA